MSSGDTPPRRDDGPGREQVVVTTGLMGLVTSLAKIVAGLTTDKALTLFVCAGFGWLLFITLKSTSEDKASQVRTAEDARERDRQFYTQQRDIDRRHCDDREDKLRTFFGAETDKNRTALAELAVRLQRLEGAVHKGPSP